MIGFFCSISLNSSLFVQKSIKKATKKSENLLFSLGNMLLGRGNVLLQRGKVLLVLG